MNGRRRAGWIAGIAALVACGAWLLRREPPAAPLRPPDALPTDAAAAADAADARGPRPSRPEGADDATRPILSRPFGAAPPVDVTNAARVFVYDDATGVPAADAEVAWLAVSADDDRPRDASEFHRPVSELLVAFDDAAGRTRTDSRGVAYVPRSHRLDVAARSGDRFGMQRLLESFAIREIRIALRAGPWFAARVVDAAGTPVIGAPVAFDVAAQSSLSGVRWMAVSRAPDGLAVADHRGGGSVWHDRPLRIAVQLATPWHGAPTVSVDEERLREGPITLTLPAAGRLTVAILDPEGAPLRGPAIVRLGAPRRGAWFDDLRTPRGPPFDVAAADGVARFDPAPAGVPLTVTVVAAAFDRLTAPVGAIPRAGEELRATVRLVRRRAALRGRLVDDDGRPLGRRTFRIEDLARPGDDAASVAATTDEDGAFVAAWDDGPPRTPPATLSFTPEPPLRDARGSVLYGNALAPLRTAEGIAELGDVRVGPGPTIVSGIVVDYAGAPLSGAYLEPVGESFFVEGRSDENGAFVLTASPAVAAKAATFGTFGIAAVHDGYVPGFHAKNTRFGARDVRVVLRAAGKLEGRLLLPERAPIGRLTLIVKHDRPATVRPRASQTREGRVDSDGSFVLDGLEPGVVTVEVRLAGVAEPLAVVDGVAVLRLDTVRDPRLNPLDLRVAPALHR